MLHELAHEQTPPTWHTHKRGSSHGGRAKRACQPVHGALASVAVHLAPRPVWTSPCCAHAVCVAGLSGAQGPGEHPARSAEASMRAGPSRLPHRPESPPPTTACRGGGVPTQIDAHRPSVFRGAWRLAALGHRSRLPRIGSRPALPLPVRTRL